MNYYYFIQAQIDLKNVDQIDQTAHHEFSCTGIESFAIDEQRVDEILGMRSYSGGDVPETVIYEVESTVDNEGHIQKYYFNSNADAINFKQYLSSLNIESELISEEIKDWNEEWKKDYKPILVSDEIEIIPSWQKEKYISSAQKSLFIYPGMGFGTGSHETTFLCLKIFTELKLKNQLTCLDFGCGSGILGLGVTAMYPKAKIDMYDIDESAIENTKQNIELNDQKIEDFELLLPLDRKKLEKKYDLVFANILQNVLLIEKSYLAKSINKSGFLILSGLLCGQETEVIQSYISINSELKHIKTLVKGDWCAVLMGY